MLRVRNGEESWGDIAQVFDWMLTHLHRGVVMVRRFTRPRPAGSA
jgi:hypothetical protein